VKRALLFTLLPVLAILTFACNAAWEVVRTNFASINFTIMNASTSFTLIGVSGGLFLTRLKWARTMRPGLGLAIDVLSKDEAVDPERWGVYLLNAGPGLGTVRTFDYFVAFDDIRQPRQSEFLTHKEIRDVFSQHGWTKEVDFSLKFKTPGGQLPVSSVYEIDQICWFTRGALLEMKRFDIRVQVTDVAGDTHERIFPCHFFCSSIFRVNCVHNAAKLQILLEEIVQSFDHERPGSFR
jgi:hypothetical protein